MAECLWSGMLKYWAFWKTGSSESTAEAGSPQGLTLNTSDGTNILLETGTGGMASRSQVTCYILNKGIKNLLEP